MTFSIIMPVYNVEKYIEKCISSILKQTYDNFELIIVNDGTKDSSIEIAKNIVKDDNRVKIYTKENGGLSDARNFGLSYATGEYVWFIDSDDYIREDALEILNKNIGADIICFGYYKETNNKIKEVLISNSNLDSKTRYLLNTPSACMRVYKNSFLKENNIKFEVGKLYEDLGCTPTLLKYTDNISFIEDCLYYYVIRDNSIMTKKTDEFDKRKDDRFWAINNIMNSLGNNYNDEVEYLSIKHLIVMYSIDIFKYNKNIYLPKINKVNSFFKDNFPNYRKNKYLKNDSIFTRIYVTLFNLKLYYLCKFIIKIAGY